MTALEHYARQAWISWAGYAKYTYCFDCKQLRYCRSRGGKKFLCLECFDQR